VNIIWVAGIECVGVLLLMTAEKLHHTVFLISEVVLKRLRF